MQFKKVSLENSTLCKYFFNIRQLIHEYSLGKCIRYVKKVIIFQTLGNKLLLCQKFWRLFEDLFTSQYCLRTFLTIIFKTISLKKISRRINAIKKFLTLVYFDEIFVCSSLIRLKLVYLKPVGLSPNFTNRINHLVNETQFCNFM